ncbi:DUF6266 family protein [Odoribacter lunatus]|uniref:DUF6266 family protein n=1 Tax=Odoribacter lunatus TaxID=2941335 RepID=UPI00203A75EF|nr:DUF6266 family protein [Odoribacter lunatus]
MSIAKSTLFNSMSGSLANIIVYEVNGKIRMRSKPKGYKKSDSPEQNSQKSKFRGASLFFRNIGMPMRLSWQESVRGTDLSGYNLFIKENIHNFTPEGEAEDFAKLKISYGPLYIPDNIAMVHTTPDTVTLRWDASCPGDSDTSDLLYLAVYDRNEKRNYKIYGIEQETVKRKAGEYTFKLPAGIKNEVHLFAFFKKQYENIYSDSRFIGTI